jgi:hypothetical protein
MHFSPKQYILLIIKLILRINIVYIINSKAFVLFYLDFWWNKLLLNNLQRC